MKNDSFFKVRKNRNRPALKSVVYETPKKKPLRTLIARAMEIRNHLDGVRPLYNELDQIVLALSTVRPEKLEKWGVAVVDNFEAKNTQFKTTAISRFSIEFKGGRR
jgi:hypothetical protein